MSRFLHLGVLAPVLLCGALRAAPEAEWKRAADNPIHAQALVDGIFRGPDHFMVVAIHTQPPGSSTFQIIASNLPIIGKEDDAGDLLVDVNARTAIVPIPTESRISLMLPLLDAAGRHIGALALVSHYHTGDDETRLFVRAAHIRDQLRRAIPDIGSLFAPASPAGR